MWKYCENEDVDPLIYRRNHSICLDVFFSGIDGADGADGSDYRRG